MAFRALAALAGAEASRTVASARRRFDAGKDGDPDLWCGQLSEVQSVSVPRACRPAGSHCRASDRHGETLPAGRSHGRIS